jgi:isoprenylcysteine carboxyl methyltransferase (ICMT) family protein YpbQ
MFVMKLFFRKLFSPILNFFESGQGEFAYRKSHRTILVVVGVLFLVLSCVSAIAALGTSQLGAFIPIVIFFIAGFVCLVVGSLGNERAVATIWGSK